LTILILSNKWDISVDYVIKILNEKKLPYLRLNTEDLIKKECTFTIPKLSYKISNQGNTYDLRDITSILLRRPGKPFEFLRKENQPSESIKNFATDQWHSFLTCLQSLEDILWINNPQKNTFAESKMNQLILAEKIGLKIPDTCITTSKTELNDFWNRHDGKIIAKALYAPLIKENTDEFFIFSNKLQDISDISDEELSLAPTIFQEELTKKTDYRLTIVGNDSFCVKITFPKESNNLDWRTVKEEISYEVADLPSDVIKKCHKLVRDLGLVFGAIDIVESNNEFYFLEINPSGEWGWLQKNADVPIAEALVDYLSGEKIVN